MNHLREQDRRRKIGQRSREIFSDTSHPASFSGARKIYDAIRREGGDLKNTTLSEVSKALTSIPAFSRHRLIQRKFPTMTTRADDKDERWQVDLMNVSSFHPEVNDGFTYLLIIIDVFSRRLAVVPLYDRKSKEVSEAMELIFMTSGRVPWSLTSDSGREFVGKQFVDLCRKYSIKQFYTVSERSHASLVERVIRTLRQKLGMLMTHRKTNRYIDELGNIVSSYNSSTHATIGMNPNEASSSVANRQLAAFHQQYILNRSPKKLRRIQRQERSLAASLDIGDLVRIPVDFKRFRKTNEPAFTKERFMVSSSFSGDKERSVFRIIPMRRNSRQALKSVYYPHEISSVSNER